MFLNEIVLIVSEGLIFALTAFGVYISFQWLKFPDLTPDGSFVIGGAIFAKSVGIGLNPLLAIFVALAGGMLCGYTTALVNKVIKIPAVISGLMVSVGLYSIGWMILGKPNQFVDASKTLVGDLTGETYNFILMVYLLAITVLVIFFINFFSNTIWGLRVRALGENSRLADAILRKGIGYYLLTLGVSNGVVALSGALFVQRSFSADINTGFGLTIVGLVGMMIGLLMAPSTAKTYLILSFIVLGVILYKGLMFATLELGLPAELFKLASAVILIVLFILMKSSNMNLMKGIRWN